MNSLAFPLFALFFYSPVGLTVDELILFVSVLNVVMCVKLLRPFDLHYSNLIIGLMIFMNFSTEFIYF